MSDDGLEITVERTGTTVRISARGEVDIATTPRLREHTNLHLADHAETVVLDLTEISFIDSTGLHALLEASNHAGERLRIIPSPACLRLFELAGMRERLPLIDSETPRA